MWHVMVVLAKIFEVGDNEGLWCIVGGCLNVVEVCSIMLCPFRMMVTYVDTQDDPVMECLVKQVGKVAVALHLLECDHVHSEWLTLVRHGFPAPHFMEDIIDVCLGFPCHQVKMGVYPYDLVGSALEEML